MQCGKCTHVIVRTLIKVSIEQNAWNWKKIVHSIKIWKKYVFIIKNIYYKLQQFWLFDSDYLMDYKNLPILAYIKKLKST